ncbi:hypothetical protein G929_04484 [Escherichia coli UMEA 3174-1]|nr:hypothetical protein G929_04484 [Escherichia coli UMEA 3174-1]
MLVSGGLLVKDKTKAAISFMSRNTATATVKATEVGMQWEQGNMKQGMLWEDEPPRESWRLNFLRKR